MTLKGAVRFRGSPSILINEDFKLSNHVTPSIGRIVWYRGQDNIVRAAIVTHVWSQFLINLHAFGKDQNDPEAGIHTSVTHGDIENEPSCCPSWSWMPYQKIQAAKTEQQNPMPIVEM